MDIDITEENCPQCKITWWVTGAFHRRMETSKENFYCPNGHSAHYGGETYEQKVQKVQKLADEFKRERDALQSKNNSLEHAISVYKGQVKRFKGGAE